VFELITEPQVMLPINPRLSSNFKAKGKIVAMVGDGINDFGSIGTSRMLA